MTAIASSRAARVSNVVAPGPMQVTTGSVLSLALAVGVFARHRWGPLLETSSVALQMPSPVRQAVPVYIAVDIGLAYVLWVFNRVLSSVYHYSGADRPVLV